jgi:hypothetical protein
LTIRNVLTGALAFIVVLSVFTTSPGKGKFENGKSECTAKVDGDIAGDGVRVSVWVQAGFICVIAFFGTMHTRKTGIKELGGGLLLTHMALTLAVILQLGKRRLSPVDAIISAMILDSQNIALSIQLWMKETLAARWQVFLVLLGQAVGLVFLGLLVASISEGRFTTDECGCFSAFWWGWIDSCSRAATPKSFWLYYVLRWIIFLDATWFSWENTQRYHLAEKFERTPVAGRDYNINGIKYSEMPSTVATAGLECAVLAIASMATAEATMHRHHRPPSSQVDTIGQTFAIIVAAGTALRVLWFTFWMFRTDGPNSSERSAFLECFFSRLTVLLD